MRNKWSKVFVFVKVFLYKYGFIYVFNLKQPILINLNELEKDRKEPIMWTLLPQNQNHLLFGFFQGDP